MKAIQISQTGGVEVLQYVDVEKPTPGPGQILVKNHAVGVNFIDTYHRTGLYKLPLPATLGREGAGTVEAVGEGVEGFQVGDRVSYVGPNTYAEYTCASQEKTYKLAPGIPFEQASAIMIQGLTALSLVRLAYPVSKGDTVLIHAAAGGTGLLLTQFCKSFGARVIGTTSTPVKAELAKSAGCDEVILYTEQDVYESVSKLTNGKGVQVVYDGVGKSTFDVSLKCLARGGTMVSFGNASGKVDPVDLMKLSVGNVKLMRPTLFEYIKTREEFDSLANELFSLLQQNKFSVHIYKAYPLAEAGKAHTDLEGRVTTGKLILKP